MILIKVAVPFCHTQGVKSPSMPYNASRHHSTIKCRQNWPVAVVVDYSVLRPQNRGSDEPEFLSFFTSIGGVCAGVSVSETSSRLSPTAMLSATPAKSRNSGNSEAGALGFAGLGEELLHQPLFVLPQGFELPALRRDQVVQRAEAVGDLLLLGDAAMASGSASASGRRL